MAKIPGVNVRPVGQYHARNLPRPDYMAHGKALGELGAAIAGLFVRDSDTELNEATASAARELTELRGKLENNNTLPLETLPDDILTEIEMPVFDSRDERVDVPKPFVYTHKVANEWWATKSEEIINTYAEQIQDKDARAKFREDMTERYVAPGNLAIMQNSATKQRAYNQASADVAIQEVLSSNAPTEEREKQAHQILARQQELGADPTWIANTRRGIGPRVDQIDIQNRIMGAQSKEEVEAIQDDMWSGGNRLSPEQMRTLNGQADKRIQDFDEERTRRQVENADKLFVRFYEDDLEVSDVSDALARDDITNEKAQVLYNALTSGTTAKASDPFTLSKWRNEIIKLPYTGNRTTVSTKGAILKNMVQMAAMGLNPNGTPSGNPPTLSGTDAATLIKEIDAKVKTALDTPEYDSAWVMIKGYTGVSGGIEGDIRGGIFGTEPSVRAATAFKQALDAYMDQFGIDADPVAFFNSNKATFHPDNFIDSVNQEFLEFYPGAKKYMQIQEDGGKVTGAVFSEQGRAQFVADMRDAYTNGSIPAARVNEIMARYAAFYLGQGIPPNNGALMLEEDNPLYRQFD